MMKKTLLIGSFLIGCILFVSFTNPGSSSPKQRKPIKTVIIDAGHGGIDPGTHGLISKEKEVTLEIAMKLGKAMQAAYPEIKIIYTRTTDILPGNLNNINAALRYRAQLANDSKGDLFISIHCDATGAKPGGWYAKRIVGYKPKVVYVGKGKKRRKKHIQDPIYESYWVENKVKGPSTYIWAADRSGIKGDAASETAGESMEGSGETVEDSLNVLDLNSPEAKIRAQLYAKFFFNNSYSIAKHVQDQFEKAGRVNKGVLQRNNKGIWVLQATGMASILIETGYLTNKDEEEYLNSEEGQAEVVTNIMDAFKAYKQEQDGAPRTGNTGGANNKTPKPVARK